MNVNVFLICYNEEVMLPHTLRHYKTQFPDCKIHLVDNQSTDQSRVIAEREGCIIVPFDTNEQQDERILMKIRSHVYKSHVTQGWVIVCDMDEWLCITAEQLAEEDRKGTTVLTTQGINMVGEARTFDLSDVQPASVTKGFLDSGWSKKVCFKYPDVSMEYWWGAHTAWAKGRIVYSKTTYAMKHYNYLGLEYLVEKHKRRYERNDKGRQEGYNQHYSNERDKVEKVYAECLARAVESPQV